MREKSTIKMKWNVSYEHCVWFQLYSPLTNGVLWCIALFMSLFFLLQFRFGSCLLCGCHRSRHRVYCCCCWTYRFCVFLWLSKEYFSMPHSVYSWRFNSTTYTHNSYGTHFAFHRVFFWHFNFTTIYFW